MDIINDFCKSRNLKLIDVSHLDFDGMFKMMKKAKQKDNVIIVINLNISSYEVKKRFENMDKHQQNDVYKVIYKGQLISSHYTDLSCKNLKRWFEELTVGNSYNCPICLENCKEGIVCPVCMSVYCEKCLEDYNKNECPVCKSGVLY